MIRAFNLRETVLVCIFIPFPVLKHNAMHRLIFLFSLIIITFISACDTGTEPPTEDAAERQQFLASSEPLPEFTTTITEAELASPRKEMKGVLNDVTITVDYGSPSVNGRDIWGSLIPYDEVWRTGANEATRIIIDKAVKFGTEELPAGTYSLFTIPHEGNWEVIFNREADQWGAYEYDEAKDVLRIEAKTQTQMESSETLEFSLGRNALVLKWENLLLPIPMGGA